MGLNEILKTAGEVAGAMNPAYQQGVKMAQNEMAQEQWKRAIAPGGEFHEAVRGMFGEQGARFILSMGEVGGPNTLLATMKAWPEVKAAPTIRTGFEALLDSWRKTHPPGATPSEEEIVRMKNLLGESRQPTQFDQIMNMYVQTYKAQNGRPPSMRQKLNYAMKMRAMGSLMGSYNAEDILAESLGEEDEGINPVPPDQRKPGNTPVDLGPYKVKKRP